MSKVTVARSGMVVADRYQLEEPLGHGAMGTVWRAEHLRLKSPVAVKLLDPAIADDPEMLERFTREAESAAAVRGTHVVQILDCGVDAGVPYIAMELLNGESLHARLRRCKKLTPVELNKVFLEVASAVGHAHEVGVIHRDLKPANLFIARAGQQEITKVLDFGIAKIMHHTLAEGNGARTRTGTLLGTPYYMSPEQARGSRTLDQRSDLWSLAVIAFECLTGERPFLGDAIGDVVVQICTASPRIPSAITQVPAGFDAWFLEGVNRDPNQRFSSAREMADSLQAILRDPNASAVTRPGGFRAGAVLESATLASSAGSGPSHTGLPRSATLELRKATDTTTALLRSTVAGLVPPFLSRPSLLLLPASLSLVIAILIARWPHSANSPPAFDSGAWHDADAARLTPADPDRLASGAAAPVKVAAPVALTTAAEAVPTREPTAATPLRSVQREPAAQTTAKRMRRRPRRAQERKPGLSENSATASAGARPTAEPGFAPSESGAAPLPRQQRETHDPFAERR